MNINRNNYEEFLLLYIDGELSADVEKEVDAFLESNADVKQEFDDLLNTKLQMEDVSFGDVSCLLKSEEKSIGLNNYEDKFLLYVDNELSDQEKKAVETFVLQHPTLQSTFTTLKNTILPLESIKHPNKEELYKKERKPIVFYLQRLAVAAVFIGLIAFIWNVNSPKTTTEIAIAQSKKVDNTANTPATNVNVDNVSTKENMVAIPTTKEVGNNNVIVTKYKKTDNPKAEKNIAVAVTKNIEQSLSNQSNINQNEQPSINNTQTLVTNNTNINTNNIPTTLAANNMVSNVQNTATHKATQVVYKSLDGDDENNKSILIAGEEIKAPKLMGIFKKAMKAITPKENADDDSKKLFAVTL